MKREIKFRIWNGHEMEMNIMAGFLGAFYVQGLDENDCACMSTFNTRYFDTTPLMQFTGLKDKNGKEIFEGDLVKHNAWDYPFEIIFNEEKARFVCKMKTGLTQFIANDELIVVGNIYQNAELLQNAV